VNPRPILAIPRLVAAAAAGLLGGVIARVIWTRPPLVLAVVLGLAAGVVALLAEELLGPRMARSGPSDAPSPAVAPASAESHPTANEATGSAPPPLTEAGSPPACGRARPPAPAPAAKRWAEYGGSGAGVSLPAPGPAPDLARFVRPDRLARPVRLPQCPHCGSFAVDAKSGRVLAFSCGACAYSWRWAPGEPWPRVVVDPRVRTAAYRDHPEGEELTSA
jgi:hypothetical protein